MKLIQILQYSTNNDELRSALYSLHEKDVHDDDLEEDAP